MLFLQVVSGSSCSIMNRKSQVQIHTKNCISKMSKQAAALLMMIIMFGSLPRKNGCPVVNSSSGTYHAGPVNELDANIFNFALNLEYLECEFFLGGVYGKGLDRFAANLTGGGPTPLGVRIANLDSQTRDIVQQFAFQEIGHIRIIRETVQEAIPRPLLDLRAETWAKFFDEAVGFRLNPPFDPYANSVNYVLAMYVVPYMGLTAYVGSNPNITSQAGKRLLAGLLGVESGQDAVIRYWLYERAQHKVYPYAFTVAEMTSFISNLRNCLGKTGIVDEGIIVPPQLGAEGKVSGNILSADANSLSYSRTPRETLRAVYSTGNESKPGGFYPQGANGFIARSYLHH
ncbi:ferritin-like catalase Nec2 isoform X2 [Cryptomeria japonica]|uniref:ferritin-like catalase Nec2 isoform X2 n=1 Tax=Cryptomeria japonica TaxID=3369 RepID=UPI0027DA1147|nr:ferritin-like catalase Nec2 isoform X2 [Cryptomeria japonica]